MFDLMSYVTPQKQEGKPMETIWIDIYDLIPSEGNFYHVDTALKDTIEIFGILQPLLVKPVEGKYEIKAGGKRYAASLALVEEGKEEFRKLPCVIREKADWEEGGGELDELSLIVTNQYRKKTEWEEMTEVVKLDELARRIKEKYKLPGRTREAVEKLTGKSSGTLARYKAIYNNLSPYFTDLFKQGEINVSTAYELSRANQEASEAIHRQTGSVIAISKEAAGEPDPEGQQEPPGEAQEDPEKEVTEEIPEDKGKPHTEGEKEEIQEEEPEPEEEPEEMQEEEEEQPGGQQDNRAEGQRENRENREEGQQGNQAEGQQAQPETVIKYIKEPDHGCGFCHPEYGRELETAEGDYLLMFDPESRSVQITSMETGTVNTIRFKLCPMCGRKL